MNLYIAMYNKIRAFVKPRDKVLYKFWNPFDRIEVVFTKRDIMIYDYINVTHLGIYDVKYNIEKININKLLDVMADITHNAPTHLFYIKYYQYVADNYMSAFNIIHS